MKRKYLIDIIIAAVALALLLVWLIGFPPAGGDLPADTVPTPSAPTDPVPSEPTDPGVPAGTLSFVGKVLEVEGDSVLMDCYLKTRFDTVWVSVPADVTPQVGEEYTVYHEDLVMPSLPPRVAAIRMEPLTDATTTPTADTSTTLTTTEPTTTTKKPTVTTTPIASKTTKKTTTTTKKAILTTKKTTTKPTIVADDFDGYGDILLGAQMSFETWENGRKNTILRNVKDLENARLDQLVPGNKNETLSLEYYDADYFKHKSLAVVYILSVSSSHVLSIDRASVDGNTLLVDYTETHTELVNDEAAYWVVLLEMEAKTAKGITAVKTSGTDKLVDHWITEPKVSFTQARSILLSRLPQTSYKLFVEYEYADDSFEDGRTYYRFRVYSYGSKPIEDGVYQRFTDAMAYVDVQTGKLYRSDAAMMNLIPWDKDK